MKIDTGSLIFIDIETVPGQTHFNEMSEQWQQLWEKKVGRTLPEDVSIESHYEDRAALYSEFGKIVCISIGYYNARGPERALRMKSLCGDNEKEILTRFCEMITQFEKNYKGWIFAGHNIREFDLPYLSRRMLIHGLGIPDCMNFFNLKPWEYTIIDTMHIWRFGDFRNYTSLELLTASLNIPSPKSDMSGAEVAEVFRQGDFERIAHYCEGDVLAVANVIQRFNGDPLLSEAAIEVV